MNTDRRELSLATRRIVNLLTVLAVALLSVVLPGAAATAAPPETETPQVIDAADALKHPDTAQVSLASASEELDARVYVLTVSGGQLVASDPNGPLSKVFKPEQAEGVAGNTVIDSDDFEKALVKYLEAGEIGDFQGEDGLPDEDVVLLVVSPDLGRLGAYAGSRVEGFNSEEITEAMSEASAGENWDAAAVAGAQATPDNVEQVEEPAPSDGGGDPSPSLNSVLITALAFLGTAVLVVLMLGFVMSPR